MSDQLTFGPGHEKSSPDTEENNVPIDPLTELLKTNEDAVRAAKQVVATALEANFSIDPIIGDELSQSFAVISSCVRRHGLLIQTTLADTLATSGRFEVLSEIHVPITVAANDLLTSQNSNAALAKIQLKSDSPVIRMAKLDLIVIDSERGWAGAYDVKRGNGETAWNKRKPIERDLRATRLVLASHLKKLGHDVDRVTTAVIDYYGGSGFSRDIKLVRDELNAHFGVAVVERIETMTAALRQEMHTRLGAILEP
ncbi:hypothetical protein, partial [Bradyrhizobium guangdongense]|uniref:hypothetical protein n=1 Tax=Bradyrhizobium guangdongense TaxID=1325090 RepID=UPI001319D826